MQNFYDTTLSQVQTETMLTMRGLPLDKAFLHGIGILPIDYPYPAYNPDTHAIEPDGEPKPNAEGTRYVQEFVVVPLPADVALKNVHAAKLTEILSGSNACAVAVKSRYTELEIDSWPRQEAQAEIVLSGGTLPEDAYLRVLAAANGVSVLEFAERVMRNVATAEAVTKLVVSQQQAYETQLKSIMADTTTDDAEKIAAIQAMVVRYELPEA